MDQQQNKTITDKVIAKIPAHINPVDFLADALAISKESVYRRIKGKVSFTLEDFIKLSAKLNFSIDELLLPDRNSDLNSKLAVFEFHANRKFDTKQTFNDTLLIYIDALEKLTKAKNTELIATSDRVTLNATVAFDHLFKYQYYRWMQQMQQVSLNFKLSDMMIPDSIISLQKQVKSYKAIGKHTYIFNPNFIKNTLIEVQYYYKRNLISEEEIRLIQDDFIKFIDLIEKKIKLNSNITNHECFIYLSTFCIESSCLYIRYDDKENSLFGVYPSAYIVSRDSEVCKAHKYWLHTLKKYASLISGCNEPLQTKFIDRQREYITNLTNKEYSYE